MVLGVICTLGVFIFYPIVMHLGFGEDWINSIDTSRYMLPFYSRRWRSVLSPSSN